MADASLRIASVVQVRQGGVRSVNVERDLRQSERSMYERAWSTWRPGRSLKPTHEGFASVISR